MKVFTLYRRLGCPLGWSTMWPIAVSTERGDVEGIKKDVEKNLAALLTCQLVVKDDRGQFHAIGVDVSTLFAQFGVMEVAHPILESETASPVLAPPAQRIILPGN